MEEQKNLETEIKKAAVAFIDQLNSFNSFSHPEVMKRVIELRDAVAKVYASGSG